ncbi:MAG: ATP-binding protein [Flavipsychrobacter sp.]|nr:ATP-binding protein [Flavipsychrobacter sp.]
MLEYLESILREKTIGTQSEILFAQWSYDKKIIPTALQAVSNLFPHYSLHDETHSVTIVNNIIRILGKENIAKLSAIDIWLILEAAYCHDIGMVVSSEKMIEAIQTERFIQYFEDILSDPKNGLYSFATQFYVKNNKIELRDSVFKFELIDGIKFILAEYFRRVHAERSKEIIKNPLSELSLLSPRGVIPPRIFNILGDICSAHTMDFNSVMKLSFCEVGIDIEDAHPRFIACLLRIGDLLDLDNNRFSEVMLRTLTKVPIDTLNHKAKHLSIDSFRVDREVIEISAKCKDYDTANITQHWFNYLNSEISDQMINWNRIVPNKTFGYLPTIGNLKVELTNYDYIDGKHKPKFTVDTDKALNLLQGAGIYKNSYQCIRELLQNAVDATLLRIWEEYHETLDFSIPQSNDFLNVVKNYPIIININKIILDDIYNSYRIEIKDNGIGISNDDLKFLTNTGSSSKNHAKTSLVSKMPTWMKPSGTFGIGFQSIFMLVDVVKIETKSYFTEKFQKIELYSTNSLKDGDILIQKIKTNHTTKPGSKIIIDFKTKAIPTEYGTNGEFSRRISDNFDPFLHKSLDVESGQIIDEIMQFAEHSYIPINLQSDHEKLELKTKGNFSFFDQENSLEMNIRANEYGGQSFKVYYKNQPIESSFNTLFLRIEINIHKEKASEILTLSRNKIKDEAFSKLFNQIMPSLYKVIIEKFDEIFVDKKHKEYASMFLHFYSGLSCVKGIDVSPFLHWKNIEIKLKGNKKITLGELISKMDVLKLIYDNYQIGKMREDTFDLRGNELYLSLDGSHPVYSTTNFFLYKAQEIFKSIKQTAYHKNKKQEIVFSKEPQGLFNRDEVLEIIRIHYKNMHGYSARMIIPCMEGFSVLRLKDLASKSYVYHYVSNNNIQIQYPKMLSPFVREEINIHNYSFNPIVNDDVINWVYENRYDSKTTKEEIIEGYKLFCEKIDIKEIV